MDCIQLGEIQLFYGFFDKMSMAIKYDGYFKEL